MHALARRQKEWTRLKIEISPFLSNCYAAVQCRRGMVHAGGYANAPARALRKDFDRRLGQKRMATEAVQSTLGRRQFRMLPPL
jgi:hypothetical protein